MQGQTIIWYHLETELKQIHDVGVHHMALGTPPENNIRDDRDRYIQGGSYKANKSAVSVQ